MIDQQTPAEASKPVPLPKFKVRMWSDCGTEEHAIIESYSVYEAALDAQYEHPEFEYYDTVRCER